MYLNKGFTIVELVVIIGITTVISAFILFSISVYINKARDVNVLGNLSVLVPAGEDFYANNNSYVGFCDSAVVINAFQQMSKNTYSNNCRDDENHPGLCCGQTQGQWASCVQQFVKPQYAYCVDSLGAKREICNTSCTANISACPDDDLSLCF